MEENAFRLTHSSHLSHYITPLHLKEKQTIRELISGRDVSLISDGTSRLGEALAIVVRFCVGWSIKQKLVRLSMLAKSLSGEEIAREILTVLSTQLGIPSGNLLAIMRDRASVNNVAVYPSAIDIGCFSHTLSHVGEKFKVPTLAKFMKHWERITKHSHKARLLWLEITGRGTLNIQSNKMVEPMGMSAAASRVIWGYIYILEVAPALTLLIEGANGRISS